LLRSGRLTPNEILSSDLRKSICDRGLCSSTHEAHVCDYAIPAAIVLKALTLMFLIHLSQVE
jgi:hypothetical protein